MPVDRRPLSPDEVSRLVESLDGWELDGISLRRQLVFASFVEAFGFMAQVALVAESLDHHPNWSNVYNRVVVGLSTHEASGVSEADFRLAGEMDALFEPGTPSTASAPSG